MTYLICYQKNNETNRLEWIVPTGWTECAIREAFAGQYPQAEILDIAPHG